MAYRCPMINGRKCPEKADKDGGCPAWVPSVIEVETQTQQERVVSDCVFRLLPRWLLQSFGQSEGVRAEMSSMRGAIATAVEMGAQKAIEAGYEIPTRLIAEGDQ